MKDHLYKNSIAPFIFGLSVFLTACSGSSEMTIPETGAALPATPGNATGASLVPGTPAIENNTGDENINDGLQTVAPVDVQQLVDSADSISCAASDSQAFKDTMLAVVLAARANSRMCGNTSHEPTTTVTWNPLLAQAAFNHVQDMEAFNFFSHEGSDGLGVSSRADGVGYNWQAIGENIAAGQLDIEEVQQGWLDSPGHCRNIMNPVFSEVGAACIGSEDTDYGTYWAVVFGNQL